jgi:hypothetical protein
MQLFPAADLHLRKHHGRAEALLLAHYGRQAAHMALVGLVEPQAVLQA